MLALLAQLDTVDAQQAPAPERRSRDLSPGKNKPGSGAKNLGSRGMIPKKKRRTQGSNPGRSMGAQAKASKENRQKYRWERKVMEKSIENLSWMPYIWHTFVVWAFWPFVYLNSYYGPIASNTFGFMVILACTFGPRLLGSGR